MADIIANALFNYLTLITIGIAMLVPSLWVSAAAGVSIAMIGVIALSQYQPDSQIVAAWLIAQVSIACATNFVRRSGRR